jgi:hypothetical protein
MNEKEWLILELLTAEPTYHFIELGLGKYDIGTTRATDASLLFFFLALGLGCNWLRDATYVSALAAISKNMHLYALAVRAFVDMFKCVSLANDIMVINSGMGVFYKVCLQLFYRVKVPEGRTVANSFLVFVDIIAREITSIQYGQAAASFPRNLVMDAYEDLEKENRKATPHGKKAKHRPRPKKTK